MASRPHTGGARGALLGQRSRMRAFLEARGARNVRLFGSLARGDDDRHSDIDLLVDLPGERSAADELMTVLELGEDLSQLVGVPVGVVTPRTLRPSIREAAFAEAVPL